MLIIMCMRYMADNARGREKTGNNRKKVPKNDRWTENKKI